MLRSCSLPGENPLQGLSVLNPKPQTLNHVLVFRFFTVAPPFPYMKRAVLEPAFGPELAGQLERGVPKTFSLTWVQGVGHVRRDS